MNEKIKDLASQIQDECRKEGVSLLCTMQKKGTANVLALGSIPDIGLCLAMQERNLDNQLPLPTKVLRAVALETLKDTAIQQDENSCHTFILNDLSDLPDILERITRGEFE
ncbi:MULTISPECIES: hypothetical protein [Enterococcus]|uniref:hypothetical protein n=1 Tax=Enterococcus TaxID=1350 RepID=UPI0026492157|nr:MULTISPECIES: hypothetical protein [Enterococcus]MEB6086716.1 hypothetical protein [Enterococcus casseliflavus]